MTVWQLQALTFLGWLCVHLQVSITIKTVSFLSDRKTRISGKGHLLLELTCMFSSSPPPLCFLIILLYCALNQPRIANYASCLDVYHTGCFCTQEVVRFFFCCCCCWGKGVLRRDMAPLEFVP